MTLTAQNIHVTLGHREILSGVSLAANSGEVTAIVGPNGSGKTTLLRALTGEAVYQGIVTMNGADIRSLRPAALAGMRAVLPQATPLSFPFTVLEVVRLGLLSGVAAARSDLPLRALSRVGLAGYEGRFYQELSGGEQQRVQLARVLAQVWDPRGDDGSPRWLFLDEPVASLDIGHQLQVMAVARDFAAAGGGVIAVMHDLNLTAMFAGQVILMAQGAIAGQGAPSDILTDRLLGAAYGCAIRVNTVPTASTFVLPQATLAVAGE